MALLQLWVFECSYNGHRFLELEDQILELLHRSGPFRHFLFAADANLVVLLGLFGDLASVNCVEDGSLPFLRQTLPLRKRIPEANAGLCSDLSLVDLRQLVLRHLKRSLVVKLLLFAVN